MVHACNLSPHEAKAGGIEVLGPILAIQFENSLCYMKPSISRPHQSIYRTYEITDETYKTMLMKREIWKQNLCIKSNTLCQDS